MIPKYIIIFVYLTLAIFTLKNIAANIESTENSAEEISTALKKSVHEIDKRNVVSSTEVCPHKNVDVLKHIVKRENAKKMKYNATMRKQFRDGFKYPEEVGPGYLQPPKYHLRKKKLEALKRERPDLYEKYMEFYRKYTG